jgi:UDP-N-acetylglucosamine--N-acetylmuramyl-(pentapeptide) pyrophosphoryl-undecaprenol N-acetylglucosamine transferase
VIFSTGGYASAPTLIAGRRMGVPALIYLPDIEPGVTIKLLSRLARTVAVSFDEVGRYFPTEKVTVSGYPVREALLRGDRAGARRRLGLPEDGLVVLAFGGSQGARSINRAIAEGAGALAELTDIVHVTGPLDYAWVCQARDELAESAGARYHVFEYLHEEMLDALVAADLAIARAGASTLGEFPAAGLPSILIPYPYSGQHQYANARFMERHGAAILIEDAQLPAQLVKSIQRILRSAEERARMADAARALARPAAAGELARQLRQLAEQG